MMTNLFSTFDPSTGLFSLNWLSSLTLLLFMPLGFWFIPNRYVIFFNKILNTMSFELNLLMSSSSLGSSLLFCFLFIFILLNNFLGLFPYIFTSSSHLVFSLSLALPLWLTFILFGFLNNTNHMFCHLVPMGTPTIVMPFMVCIEIISNFMTFNSFNWGPNFCFWHSNNISYTKLYCTIFWIFNLAFNYNSMMASYFSRGNIYSTSHNNCGESFKNSDNLTYCISDFLFYFFFWGFFHSSLSPVMEIGMVWPPVGIKPFNPMQIPLLNTMILLCSGVTITWAHHSVMESKHSECIYGIMLTLMLGVHFTILQVYEYYESPFCISDSVYGSTFFVSTGFHGIHVIIGSTFIMVCLLRQLKFHFSSAHHFGFEAAAWYWHFVDIVWLFLYVSIYWWGS